MARKSITIIPTYHLYVKYKKADGLTAVYLSYFVQGQTVSVSTKVKVLVHDWDDMLMKVKSTDREYVRKNNILSGIVSDADRRIKEYYDEGNVITPQDVRRILNGDEIAKKRTASSTKFIDYALETNDLRYDGQNITYSKWYNDKLSILQFGKFLSSQLGEQELKVSQINDDYILRYIKWRQEVRQNKSREGINKTLSPLIKAAERAANNDLLPNKIFVAMKESYLQSRSRQYTGEDEEDENIHCLDEKQIRQFIELYPTVRASTQRYMDLFLFSIHSCGLRISDIITLEWRHIDFENRRIRKNLVKFNKPHEVYITDSALQILKKYKGLQASRFVFGLLPDEFNLGNADEFLKKRQSINRTVQTSLTAIGKKIGLAFNLTMHVARHTFAVLALRKGVSLHMISFLMGHSSAVVTEKRYAKFLPEDKDEVVKEKLSFDFLPY